MKLINLHELSYVEEMLNDGKTLLTSGIIEVAYPGKARELHIEAHSKITEIIRGKLAQ